MHYASTGYDPVSPKYKVSTPTKITIRTFIDKFILNTTVQINSKIGFKSKRLKG